MKNNVNQNLQLINYKPLPMAIFLGALLFILASISNYLHFSSLQSQLHSSIKAQSVMIADNIAPALQFLDDSAALAILNSLQSNSDISSALLMDQNDRLFSGWLTHRQQIYSYDKSPIAIRSRAFDQQIIVPIMIGNQIKGRLIVDYSRAELKQKTIASILGSSLVIIIMVLVTYFLLIRIQQVQKSKQVIEHDHRQTQDSIRYASLIQNAFIPNDVDFNRFFADHFCIWQPKDIVGGDIYTLSPLRNDHEVLIMVIDCTGHGVPGAFVSMLVKAIEQQIVTKLLHQQEDINPANILASFNQSLSVLLNHQAIEGDVSLPKQHAGFDGGVFYYDRQRQLVRFSGANLSLFYINEGEVSIIKGNRSSVGYRSSGIDYSFTEHELSVHSGMTFYLTTDGYIDQNGGDKNLPFGKRRFVQMLKEYQELSLAQQAHNLKLQLQIFQKNEAQTDDITLIGVKI